ncbi:TlpA disulfide reductase family protein [uncultured Alistipes sp.]|jgi:hypothetical protein|uniref:TlpA family protein disulfide reductase n=1 Tax=uncultured Alistipes sp. TaxID=538949 RepID=UPI0025D923F4|nr:TlpA disulfide reductase family protein [uncultured Alistipes sp.]
MKKILFFISTAFLLLVMYPCQAQTGKYYINDRPTNKESVERLPVALIESMENTVENGEPVVRIKLKESADGKKIVIKGSDNPGETRDERTANMMRSVYEQTTLLKEGDMAADFTAEKYAGGNQALSSLRGKVILLNFWATWCGPCLKELAPDALPKVILEPFGDNPDFVFLPVAYTNSREQLDKFFEDGNRKDYDYLKECTWMDPDRTIFGLYAEKGVPRSVLIDREGRIVLGSLGASPAELTRIAEAVAKELAK